MLPGASSLWSGTGELAARLRLFERDAAVIPGEIPADETGPLPAPDWQTRHVLRKGTADFILKTGCGSACLNLLESAFSSLLAHVLKKSLPDLPVTGFIPRLVRHTGKGHCPVRNIWPPDWESAPSACRP